MNEYYTYPYCKFGREKAIAVLLYNALHPLDRIETVNINMGNTKVRRVEGIFGRGKVLCPSMFIKDVFTVGVFSPWHEYEFIKRLKD